MRPRLLHLGYDFVVQAYFEPRLTRFNEAEAFTPRIRLEVAGEVSGVNWASMRPRLLHLGYVPRWGRQVHAGPGFNEAEAFTPRILR